MIGRRTKILLLLLLIAVGTIDRGCVFAQTAPTGCPSIMAAGSVSGRDTVLPHGGCITLRAEVVATATTANDYTVSQIQYNPPFSFQSGTQINLTSDDYYAAVINLPFPFCFYGNTYTQACVGANGVVSFNVSNNGGYCAYNYSSYVPIPNANFPSSLLNAIYGVCEDIWPGHTTGGGRIFQGVLGTYPCRTACISYDQCPLFGNYTTNNSYQIVIYEGTNIIDVYIKNRDCCSSTNRGQGLVGLQNANGTRAVTAPNRNGGVWTTTNEAWRFTPVGTPDYTVSWYYGTDTSASGQLLKIDTIQSDTAMSRLRVCPIAADTFTARLKYVACNGDSFDMISSTVITNAGLTYFDTVLCASDCYSFNGKRYCSPGVYVDTLKDGYGYDSIISRIRISDTIRDTIHRTICAGTSFDTNGQRYYLAGQYIQHLRQPDSCFNNLVIDLTVSDTLRDTIYRTICAGASFDTNGQRYYLAGQYIQHLRQPDSCFNNLVIDLTVSDTLRDTIHRTICAGASFDTNGQRYYLAGQYVQHLRQPDSCFNNLVIDLTVSDTLRDTIHRTICAGASFDTNGQRYYLAGQYIQHLRQPDSCYNNLVIDLTVSDTIRDTIHRTICAGTSFDTNGQRYYLAGQYIQHLRQPDSCFNNLVINLTVSDTIRDTIHRTICAGASFDTNGQRYYLAGQYIQHLRQPNSCFNNLVINLTVSDTLRDTIHRTICAGASFDTNGQRYYLAGQYVQHLQQPDSCFNNLVIDLTVSDTLRDTIYRTICAGTSFDTNGQRYYLAGQYTQHLRQPDSCFNNLVIRLTVNDTIRDTIHRTICAGASFDTNGLRYVHQGFYSQLLRDATTGCYNRLYINLIVRDTFRTVIWQNICAGATFSYGGQSYYLQGTYLQQRYTVHGCDSITEIHLTVNDTIRDTVEFDVCAGQTVNVNGRTYYRDGWYRQNLRTLDGCDSILHIHLNVADTIRDTLYFSVCAGKTIEVNGQTYANRGWYRQRMRTPDGCDSILHFALMVDDTIRSHDYDTICDGQLYRYHDSVYRTSGAYRHLLKTPDGCDSIVTMHLFVRDTSITHLYDTIERGDSSLFFGRWYTEQGIYSQVLTRSDNGCDSTIMFHLKVCHTKFTYLYDTVCTNHSFRFGDTVYTRQGVYSRVEYTEDFCDSVIVLNLAVIDYPTLSLVDSGSYCEGGVATLAAVTNANHITWSSLPTDSTLFGQENEFVIHVSPDRYVEYIATVDKQPYNCETSDVISLNKPATLIADIAINPAEITNDNLAVTFSDNSIGEVVSRRWLFHEDDPTTRDKQVLNDSIVHYTASPLSDSLEVTLIVASGYGCHDTARNIYPIRKGDIWVPNAFTPGRRNAGQNSLFKVKYNNVLEYEINIYTREGMLVFHSTNPDISWDGTYKYKDCKSGSYVYVVRYTTKKYPKLVLEQKGMVLLIR